MRDGVIPPTINLKRPAKGCDLNFVVDEAKQAKLSTVLVNARGYGGFNGALVLRGATLPPALAAFRVVNGEGDRLPGVVVDRYGDFLVCQFLTAGAARLASIVVSALRERLAPRGIFERSEGAVRIEEGLSSKQGVLAGEDQGRRFAAGR